MICRVCDSTNLEPVIDLGEQPWCNHFLTAEQVGKEPFYPLRVVFCKACSTAQLDYTVKKEIMFADHTYLSGMTKTLSDHFAHIAQEVDDRFFKDRKEKAILDIGSNDGTQIGHYKALGYAVQGVESSTMPAEIANKNGLNTLHAFFNKETAEKLGRKYEVINASGVFFHLEELHSVTEGIKLSLAEDGVFVVQFLYMKRIAENCAFDQIYHEHLLYYNLETLKKLLSRHGLELFDAYLSPIHGGSMIGFVGHPGKRPQAERLATAIAEENAAGANTIEYYQAFAKRIEAMKERNLAYLRAKKAEGKKVFGMGAPVKGNTLLNYFGVGPDLVQVLLEKNTLRRGLYSPGMHIPVHIEGEYPGQPDVYYVLAWNFRKEILARNQALIAQGIEFFFPVEAEGS
ncbi:Methyltransferase domain-containing protein [Verrucomicrobium sp. GAS474]|uniref:class I SAM-dependent methyltransferase n=1 Tax=Verrucomicrobium sp. GAS474 TaxID=1882831 RepID=UPI00087DBC62|nr:class I SAM-dependent methyltransferase [Verrucomicrobium sp. GAS474]SDU21387.1 Methyltransferase domain-containing protein [Verrucomicrobium sp. GAS474]